MSLLLLLSVSIPITFNTKAHVPFPLAKTMEQFTSAQQLQKWFLPFAGLDSSQFTTSQAPQVELKGSNESLILTSAKPGNIDLLFKESGSEQDYKFLISRDQKKNIGSIVTMSISNTLWKRMIDPDPIDEIVINSLKNLDRITNNTELYYGYLIKKLTVTDSTFLYATAVVKRNQKASAVKILFDSLFQFAGQNYINYTGRRILSAKPLNDSEMRIFTGIVINGPATIDQDESGISVKTMHAGKGMLVAEYNGVYKNISSVYKALESYKRDNQLASMELPFEEFLNNGNKFEPDDTVNVKVCYPVF
ncbi:hypothetical protein [Flavihumibacter profundi]|uniref:hypothetical protein n=1 Tax=Flavihumibacter profundi TaxID=2716883 RepID=UPI001CC49111|nr:hypothetical protein [Flavihumibacter profundi]MBZ5858129.1 hypothetical protein [Flavihumibacter profundi]